MFWRLVSIVKTRNIVRERSLHSAHRCYSQKSKQINVEELSPYSTQVEIANALRPHFEEQYPVLLKGVNVNNDAIENWKSLEYLETTVGEDTSCTVEIGGSYSNSDLERPEICFGDFIQYIKLFQERYENGNEGASGGELPNRKELVYLAQNDLFSSLQKDFELPDLCCDSSLNVGGGSLYSTMFWFGPRGCVSPLHYDPLDNLLMQFVGRKKVILFPKPADNTQPPKSWHYAGHNGQQYNTSPIDILNPDLKMYPLFAMAPTAIVCDLDPGDICYIPQKWWHHVTSHDTSISVNAWWR